jgi:splicing factor 3B subunit 1
VFGVHVVQVGDDANVMLNGFGTVVNALGKRAKPYLPQICGTIKWRLNNKAAKIRQQAADLIARIAPVLKACEEEQLLGHLGVVLYEYLGEEVRGTLGVLCCMLFSAVVIFVVDSAGQAGFGLWAGQLGSGQVYHTCVPV